MEKEITTQRIADALTLRGVEFEVKKMFGSVCFFVDDKMIGGASRHNKLLVRVDPTEAPALLNRPEVSLMEPSGRSMHGFLYVDLEGYESDADLEFWLERCLAFNPLAKASKKKK